MNCDFCVKNGSSLGQFFSQYLEPIKLNDVKVEWNAMDLGYLTEGNYTKYFSGLVRQARPIQGPDLVLKAQNIKGDVRIRYKDQAEFERIAGEFGIFEEWKDGVPRTAYKGIVVFRIQTTRRVFLDGNKEYNLTEFLPPYLYLIVLCLLFCFPLMTN
ncbi:3-mannosyl-glycoprotein 2-beta-N-acetylglucosaminyltransferase [Raphanus sativus]|nr:3-mannosyl-glycoprotein 2-beta-N-acetylglucosaminyltransferase [Raphanus sativus]